MTLEHSSYLTPADRARLRPTVDIAALERFLASTPPNSHRFYFLACVATLTDAERRELGLLADIPPEVRDEVEPEAYWAPARNHRLVSHLLNPTLEQKWRDVEPSLNRGA